MKRQPVCECARIIKRWNE